MPRGLKTKELWKNPEYRERMSLAHLGIKMPPFTQEHKDKIRKTLTGKKHTPERIANFTKAMKGKPRPFQRGEKSRFWKGGRTVLNLAIKNLIQYHIWRSTVFQRDDFTCQTCHKRGGQIQAHHIKAFYLILDENKIKTTEDAVACEELWNLSNGSTLCRKCHFKTPNYGRNKKND